MEEAIFAKACDLSKQITIINKILKEKPVIGWQVAFYDMPEEISELVARCNTECHEVLSKRKEALQSEFDAL